MPTPTDFSVRLFRLWRSMTNAGFAFVTALLALLLAGAAFAQDGGVVDVPALADDPIKALTGTAENFAKGDYWPAAGGVISLLTWAFRSGVLKRLPKEGVLAPLGRAGMWLYTNPIAALATPFALSAALGAITTFANGTPFTTMAVFGEVMKVGTAAVVAFISVEKIKEAKNAGKLASAGITTQQEAIDELTKRVLKGPPA